MEIFLFQILPVVILLLVAYFTGTIWLERKHFRSLEKREQEFQDIGISNQRMVTNPETVKHATAVFGDAVIATDYFKSFIAGLRNLIGGEMKSFETLMRRARREATLRMLAEARRCGATEVWNVRYGTSNIRSMNSRSKGVSVEVFAFGTAVERNRKE